MSEYFYLRTTKHIPDATKKIDQQNQFADDSDMVKCPHCEKEYPDFSAESDFIGWHGLCADCVLNGIES